MRMIIQPDRNYLKRIKCAHAIRAIIRRDGKTATSAQRKEGTK